MPAAVDPKAVVAVAVLGIFSTGFTFYLSYRLIADEGATSTATVGYLLPVVSVVLGALVPGENVGLRVIAGMIVVLVGVGMTRRQPSVPAIGPAAPVTPPAGERPRRVCP